MANLRAFASQARLWSLPLCGLDDRKLLALLRAGIHSRDLILLREGAGVSSAGKDSTAALRYLVRLVEARSRGHLAAGGRQYKLVADADLAKVPRRDDFEVVRHDDASHVLADIASEAGTPSDLAALLEQASAKLTRDWRPPLFPDGLILLRKSSAVQAPVAHVEAPVTPSQLAQMLPIHWVEFRIRDAGGRPLGGLRYTVDLPDGSEKTGKLDSQGKVRHEGQPGGDAALVLADIDEIFWSTGETEADTPVELAITTSGIDEGEAVTFEIFRHYRERPSEVVAKLAGKIEASGDARVRWQADSIEDPNDVYVFKASVAGLWRKSDTIAVVHEAASATWSGTVAAAGDTLTLRAQVRGVKDGDSAYFTIFEKAWRGLSDPDIDQVQSTVNDGMAEATFTIPDPIEPPARGDDGRRHLFFIAEAGGVFATSEILTVESSQTEDEP